MKAASQNSGSRIANVIITPMVAVVGIAVICIFALVYWSARITDASADDSEAKLLSGTLQLRQDYMIEQQKGVVVWDTAYRMTKQEDLDAGWIHNNMTHWLYRQYGFDKALLIGPDRSIRFQFAQDQTKTWLSDDLLDQLKPAVARVRAKFINAHRETPSGLFVLQRTSSDSRQTIAEAGVILVSDTPYLFSAAAITPLVQSVLQERSAPSVLISFAPLAGNILGQIQSMSRLENLQLGKGTTEVDGRGHLALASPRGAVIGELVWTVSRPGTQMLDRIFPPMVVIAAMIGLIVVVVVIFIRHTTQRLAYSESQAVIAARHDALSGLPNRSRFNQLLREALLEAAPRKEGIGVVYIDLDHFKDINDTMGHSAGDMVIVAVAERLTRVMPETSVVARISGDEFAMLIRDCDSEDWVEYLLNLVQDEIAKPVQISQRQLHISLSMGAALSPRDGTDADDILRKADIALYDAKANGRGRRSFFEPSMEDGVRSRDKMSRELRQALDNDELHLAYQPQTDTEARRIVTVEALARWRRDDGTMVSPAEFIPVAEETGLINDLGLWVLNKACHDAHRWPDLVVSVNVSPNQFKHPRFVEKVMSILAANDLPPHRLEIEVTESVFTGRNTTILTALRRLKGLGVKVALDDFGSGYSSLSYLRRFPFDTLKIDRDFVSDMDGDQEAEAILASIIKLGKALGMTIVAEGIETAEQMQFLQAHGCHRMQGFHISAPVPVDALDEFLNDFAYCSQMESSVDEAKAPRTAKAG